MSVISIQCSNYPCQMRSQYLKNYRLNKLPFVKGGRHLGKPSQIWSSPNHLYTPPPLHPTQNFWNVYFLAHPDFKIYPPP